MLPEILPRCQPLAWLAQQILDFVLVHEKVQTLQDALKDSQPGRLQDTKIKGKMIDRKSAIEEALKVQTKGALRRTQCKTQRDTGFIHTLLPTVWIDPNGKDVAIWKEKKTKDKKPKSAWHPGQSPDAVLPNSRTPNILRESFWTWKGKTWASLVIWLLNDLLKKGYLENIQHKEIFLRPN